ncbi:MAG: teichoic acid biosynthesis protein [Myxococcales bacterium]|nr:teichoic acid biosynthesis protein [Myxococcales bacterium]
MKILYGVVGEGMGHAVRSRVVVEHLLARGCEVEIVASSRAADFLSQRFPEVHRIHGLHILYEENRVRKGPTILSNALKGVAAIPKQVKSYFELIEDFAPQVVISDFESWTHLYAKVHRLPILSIDNMQILNRCQHPPEIVDGIKRDFELTKTFIKSKMSFCDHYLITTFFFPEIRRDHTTLVPPILRPEILATQTSKGDHLLVYQTAEGHDALPRALAELDVPCRIYGMHRGLSEDLVAGKITHRPFDEQTFVADLASARAVVCGGGFTVLSECVYLRKPTLSVPVVGQVEQIVNGRYLQHEGYGMAAQEVDAHTLSSFLENLPSYEAKLADYHQEGNKVTFQTLDRLLDAASQRSRR